MFTCGIDRPILAMSQDTLLTSGAAGALGVGLILLFLGIKLARLLFTLAFATLGAAVGRIVAQIPQVHSALPQADWVAAIGGAVILGLTGFLLYRLWVIVSLGGMLAVAAAGGYLCNVAGEDVGRLQPKLAELSGGYVELLALAPQAFDAIEDIWRNGPNPEAQKKFEQLGGSVDQKRATRTLDLTVEVGGKSNELLRNHGLGMSIAAVVGLVVGLLIGGLAWRFAAVIMTSIWGLIFGLTGGFMLCSMHRPDLIAWIKGMGWTAWMGLAGIWLMGVSIQGLLARKKKKKAPPTAEPVEAG